MSEFNPKFTRLERGFFELIAGRYSFVIQDPFPEYTEWQRWEWAYRWLGIKYRKPTEISVHAAYQQGFNAAWDMIEKKLNHLSDVRELLEKMELLTRKE